MGLRERARRLLERIPFWRSRVKEESLESLSERLRWEKGLPSWAVEKIREHNITHVFDDEGDRKHITKAKKEEILGEIFVRDYLKWVANRAGKEDLLEHVKNGTYNEHIDEFREADRMAISRAVREFVSEATMPNEEEIREMLEIYWRMVSDPSIAKHLKAALESGHVEIAKDIAREKGIIKEHTNMEKVLDMVRRGMAEGRLWMPPGWEIKRRGLRNLMR
jgi:hypothetical protein